MDKIIAEQTVPARPKLRCRKSQAGVFLLEALIAILVFSFGILGIVGLQARAIQTTNDAQYRAEATYLANSVISKMWTDSRSTLFDKYDTRQNGDGYKDFV